MPKKLTTVIVDDEAPARNELSFLLSEIDTVELIAEAANAQQALEVIKEKQPQLLFLDIKLPGQSGLEVAKQLQELDFKPPVIIFSTAYDEYAVKAFELNAVDYLLKPYQKSRLEKAIEKVLKRYQENSSNYQKMQEKLNNLLNELTEEDKSIKLNKLAVNGERGRVKLLDYQDLIFLSTANGSVYAKTADNEYNLELNLTEAEKQIASKDFLRVHRSYLINLKQVKELVPWFKGQYKVVMADNDSTEISISRSKVKEIKEIFNL